MARCVARVLARAVLAAALAAALTAALTGPLATGAARADGDPASDILLGQDVFYPYQPAVSGPLARALDAQTAAARRAGLHLKVALIGGRIDLGVIQQLFGRPQAYADFLEREIDFNGPQPLLVVMADGYGVAAVRAPAATLASLPTPGATSDDLARAALAAVVRLADASGHPVTHVKPVATGAGSDTAVIAAAVAVAAVLAAAGLLTWRRRRALTRRRRGRGGGGKRPAPARPTR